MYNQSEEKIRLSRREFLKLMGFGSGAFTLASLSNSLLGEVLDSIEPNLEKIPNCLSEYMIGWRARPWVWVNLAIASKFIGGLRIDPGKEFSLNQALRFKEMSNVSRENTDPNLGYVAAQMSDPTKLDGWGYGLCLASTAIFRAFLRSPLLVLERHTHFDIYPEYFRDPEYPLGTDAAIFYPDPGDNLPQFDLKFLNPTDKPVFLHFSVVDPFGEIILPPGRELSLFSYKAVYLEHLVRILRRELEEKGAGLPSQYFPEDTLGNRKIFVRAAFSGEVEGYRVSLTSVRRDMDGNYFFQRELSLQNGETFREVFVSEYKS